MSSSICASWHAQYGWALAIDTELTEARDVVGVDDLDVGDVRPRVGRPVRLPGGRDGIECLAHGPVADGVEMRLEPERVEARDVPLERLGIDHAQAAVVRRVAVVVQVRLDEAAGPVLEDAVLHQLDAGRGVAADRRTRATLDELLDLLRATRPIPPQRPDDPGRQLATTGERRVGDLLAVGRRRWRPARW